MKNTSRSFENLELIRSVGVKCPLLCKEFIIDAWQLYYDQSKGADAVLLIAVVLPDLDIKNMVKICKLLGLAALVEMHDEREFDRILGVESVELIGINNLQNDIALAMTNCQTHIPSKKPENGGKEKIKVKICLNLHGIVTVDSETLFGEEEIEVPVTKESAEEDSK
ncbi:hypothetical protein KIW84_014591 [Lathyrus oleraceus]|uniref:indole-3-glycerol-phosphate synthase n=1 Tax=Pisum sativum TaxID=3888 RepID=A0A9D5GZG1_PEA|nr:hypothetical protein KIW84_014591 [Pisum sativum]